MIKNFLSAFVLMCCFLAVASNVFADVLEEKQIQELNRRYAVKESFLNVVNQYRLHASALLKQRAENQEDSMLSTLQTDFLDTLLIRYRVTIKNQSFVPRNISFALERNTFGQINFSQENETQNKIHWYEVFLRHVPIGERLLEVRLEGDNQSFLNPESEIDQQKSILVATKSIFVGNSDKIQLNLRVERTLSETGVLFSIVDEAVKNQ